MLPIYHKLLFSLAHAQRGEIGEHTGCVCDTTLVPHVRNEAGCRQVDKVKSSITTNQRNIPHGDRRNTEHQGRRPSPCRTKHTIVYSTLFYLQSSKPSTRPASANHPRFGEGYQDPPGGTTTRPTANPSTFEMSATAPPHETQKSQPNISARAASA